MIPNKNLLVAFSSIRRSGVELGDALSDDPSSSADATGGGGKIGSSIISISSGCCWRRLVLFGPRRPWKKTPDGNKVNNKEEKGENE